jgi:hypothetical protein
VGSVGDGGILGLAFEKSEHACVDIYTLISSRAEGEDLIQFGYTKIHRGHRGPSPCGNSC